MEKFATDSMRGIGSVDFALGLGPFGIDLPRASRSESQQRKHDLCRSGWRFPVTRRRSAALLSMEFGSLVYRKECDIALMLPDFATVSHEAIGEYAISGAKYHMALTQPTTISALNSAAGKQKMTSTLADDR